MPNWPATKLLDPMLGLDYHAVSVPPAPVVPMVPHPFFGALMIWLTPTFPKMDVFINGLPAAGVGALGLSMHIPSPLPSPPTMANLHSFFVKHFINVPKALGLALLTLFANLAIAAIAKHIPKMPPAVNSFVKDVTGIDTSTSASMWDSIKGSFASYTKWTTWVKLLIPPLPYPGSQGSTAVGSPNVTVNGGPLGFNAPLMAASCSDLQFVPNAALLGFSNVFVGVSLADMARGLAVNAAQAAVSAGVGKAAAAVGGRMSGGCGS